MALFMLCLIAVLVWQIGAWLRSPATLEGGTNWVNVECGFGASQPATGAWKACKLPHNWDIQKPDYSGDAWYRLVLPSSADNRTQQGLWLFASMNAEVWVNGIRLGSGGRMQEPVARHWSDSLFFSLPAMLPERSVSEVMIHVRGYANNSSGLSKLITGPYELLHAEHQSMQFRSQLLTFGSLAITMLVGLLTMLLAKGRQSMLIYFSLGCLLSSLYLLDQVMVNIPVSRDIWESGVHLSMIWSQMFFLLFLVRFLKIELGWVTYGLFAYGFLAMLTLFFTDSVNLIIVATLWEGVSLFFLLIAIVYMLYRWCTKGFYLALVSGLALSFAIMAFLHDWVPFVLGSGVSPPFLFYMGPTGFLIIMAAVLVIRLANAYRYEKGMSLELGDVVWRNAKELEDVRRNVDDMMKKRATLEERDRILRELHDGVGGLLANTLAVVKPSESHVRNQLSEALDELRMMMGTLDEDADISSLLGLHRSKLQSAIEAAGGQLYWEFHDVPAAVSDNAGNGMQLVRIVQECVHNALRHGHATEITVHIDQSCCRISDNGCGFDVEQVQSGRGLKNLRWRAEQLNAKINIHSNAAGTRIDIFWDSSLRA